MQLEKKVHFASVKFVLQAKRGRQSHKSCATQGKHFFLLAGDKVKFIAPCG